MSYEAMRKLLLARSISVPVVENHRTSNPHGRKLTPATATKGRLLLLTAAEAKDTLKQTPTITATPNNHPFPNSPQPCTCWAAGAKHDVVASFPTTRTLLPPRGIIPQAMDEDIVVVEVTVAAAPSSVTTTSLVSLSESPSTALLL
jgi:hypothetical protein